MWNWFRKKQIESPNEFLNKTGEELITDNRLKEKGINLRRVELLRKTPEGTEFNSELSTKPYKKGFIAYDMYYAPRMMKVVWGLIPIGNMDNIYCFDAKSRFSPALFLISLDQDLQRQGIGSTVLGIWERNVRLHGQRESFILEIETQKGLAFSISNGYNSVGGFNENFFPDLMRKKL